LQTETLRQRVVHGGCIKVGVGSVNGEAMPDGFGDTQPWLRVQIEASGCFKQKRMMGDKQVGTQIQRFLNCGMSRVNRNRDALECLDCITHLQATIIPIGSKPQGRQGFNNGNRLGNGGTHAVYSLSYLVKSIAIIFSVTGGERPERLF
jgi:hypothetical protein